MPDAAHPAPDPAAVAATLAVMHAHMAALNATDAERLAQTLHFPHFRLSGGRLQTWAAPDTYLADFRRRAEPAWARSQWDFLNVVAAGAEKVHIDAGFTRFDAAGTVLGRYRSLWVIARLDGRWAAQLRSSFAA